MKVLKNATLGLALLGLFACGSGSAGGGSTGFNSGAANGAANSSGNGANATAPTGTGSTFVFRFSNAGNASTVDLMSVGTLTPIFTTVSGSRSNPTMLQANFLQIYNPPLGANPQPPNSKRLLLTLNKPNGIATGDVLTLATPSPQLGAFADYSEDYSGSLRSWSSTGGTVTVNSLVAGTAVLTVTNLLLSPNAALNNTAAGTVTVNGTATLAF